MKLEKKSNMAIATLAVFGLLSVIYVITTARAIRRDRDHALAQAELNAKVYSSELVHDFDRGIFMTDALEEVIINGKGEIHDFEALSENLMRGFASSIQIAPGGVVTDIYPMEGNEGGLIDILHDPERGPVARYSIEHDEVAMQGPFQLKQGGLGIAVRNPVFLSDGSGGRTFWGFTVAIIKAPEIFSRTLSSLESFGYDYALYTTGSPLSGEYQMVASTAEDLDDPASATVREGGCDWRLDVAPKAGWTISGEVMASCVMGGFFVVLLTVMLALILRGIAHRNELAVLAETDALTGLLNRKGLSARIERFFARHPQGPATEVFLDIDDFKIINDLYGHDVGDQALQTLAKNLEKAFGDAAIVSRSGGDEFGVFLPGMKAEEAEPLIRAASEMDQSFRTRQGRICTFTISMGYADLPAQAGTREELSRNVDSALYNVKLNGKHGCQRFVPGMTKQSRQQLGFTQKELLGSLPGAGFICRMEDSSILYANDDLVRLFECDDLEDFKRVSKGKFENMIHPDDHDRIMSERQEKLDAKAEGEPICCHFRIVTKTGALRNMIAQARHRRNETFGDLFFVTSMDLDA